jgi:negative regulator of sigma E activity
MVRQCRREVTKLREIIKQMQRARRSEYQRGYLRGRKTGLDAGRYGDTLPQSATYEELAAMSHRYPLEP